MLTWLWTRTIPMRFSASRMAMAMCMLCSTAQAWSSSGSSRACTGCASSRTPMAWSSEPSLQLLVSSTSSLIAAQLQQHTHTSTSTAAFHTLSAQAAACRLTQMCVHASMPVSSRKLTQGTSGLALNVSAVGLLHTHARANSPVSMHKFISQEETHRKLST